ncbi:MAG: NSS family neurotransmitter:Na+ symporter [Arenicella sp.]
MPKSKHSKFKSHKAKLRRTRAKTAPLGLDDPSAAPNKSWTSYWSFLFAAIGSAVGLGNIWKFPYELGLHGGGTFLVVYIPCVFLIAFPLMMSEIMIGRSGRANPVHAVRRIAKRQKLSSLWQIMGWLGMIAGFLVFSFYSVVGSWVLFYIMQSATGSFVDVPAEIVQHSFGALLRNTDQQLIWHGVFVLTVVTVLSRRLRFGLELALKVLMPCFLALLVWLCVFATQVGDFDRAITFFTTVDVSAINAELVVSALTQALFSLSIGLGALIMFGSYLGEHRPIATAAGIVMVFDTAIALTMGLLIFSIVFAFGMRPDSGAGLIFETLPVAFSQMPHNSVLWSTLFFTLVGVAALTSGFALLEPSIAWMIRQFRVSRPLAAWFMGCLAWLLGVLCIYSFNDMSFSFYYFGIERTNGLFDFLNILTTNVLMPLTAILVTVFAGWRISSADSRAAMAIPIDLVYRIWHFCTRMLVPMVLALVLIVVLLYPA